MAIGLLLGDGLAGTGTIVLAAIGTETSWGALVYELTGDGTHALVFRARIGDKHGNGEFRG